MVLPYSECCSPKRFVAALVIVFRDVRPVDNENTLANERSSGAGPGPKESLIRNQGVQSVEGKERKQDKGRHCPRSNLSVFRIHLVDDRSGKALIFNGP